MCDYWAFKMKLVWLRNRIRFYLIFNNLNACVGLLVSLLESASLESRSVLHRWECLCAPREDCVQLKILVWLLWGEAWSSTPRWCCWSCRWPHMEYMNLERRGGLFFLFSSADSLSCHCRGSWTAKGEGFIRVPLFGSRRKGSCWGQIWEEVFPCLSDK